MSFREPLQVTGRKLRRSLVRVQGEVMKLWAVASALRLREVLATGRRTDGTDMPPLRESTKRIKKSRGLDPRVGVRRTRLLNSLKGAANIVSRHYAEIRGHNGSKNNSMKSRFLIFGRAPSDGSERSGVKRKRKIKADQYKAAPRKDGGQIPRDYMGIDKDTVDMVAERAAEAAWTQLGW